MDIHEGRWTARIDGDFVVLIIGARVGNPIRAMRALPLLASMPKMLADLTKDPTKGLLGFQQHGRPFGVIVQYWRSFEALEAFARDPGDRHAQVWREWYRRAQHKNSAVSIWHETYRVRAGEYEAIYQNVPAIGLMKAGVPTRIGERTASARARLGIEVPAQTPAPTDEGVSVPE